MFIDRRTFMKGSAVAGAAAVAPQVLVRTARGQDKNKVLFVSEESNPKAIAVYDKINADFKKETGIEVVMEYPGFANIAKRVATLIAAGTPPEIVWYGAGQAMNLALENQLADATSLLNLYRRLTALRRSRPALTHGSYHPVAASGDLLVYIRAHEGERILVALNLGGDPVALELTDENMKGRLLVSSLGDRDGEAVNKSIDLRGHEGAVIGFDR